MLLCVLLTRSELSLAQRSRAHTVLTSKALLQDFSKPTAARHAFLQGFLQQHAGLLPCCAVLCSSLWRLQTLAQPPGCGVGFSWVLACGNSARQERCLMD